jgi:serine phosphatase RsbU (regulator of sigma subunit)
MRKTLLLTAALAMCSVPVPAQEQYWELPSLKAPSRVSYSGSAANEDFLVLSWQERTGSGESSAVNIWVDTARLDAPNTDTRWTGRRLLHGPIPLAGVGEEPRMHAIAMDDRRILAVVVLPSATGAEGSEVLIKSSGDGGGTFRQVARFTLRTVVTSPNLSRTAAGGWLLMMTQSMEISSAGGQAAQGKLSIAYCTSSDGETWSGELKSMVKDPRLTQNIQPHHVVQGKIDYVVFQSKRVWNHLYLVRSTTGGETWDDPVSITSGPGFTEAAGGRERTPDEFNNQRPSLAPLGDDRLALAWERALAETDQSQIYYCEIDGNAAVVRPKEVVSRGVGALYPQLVPIDGGLRLLYVEQQLNGPRLVLASRSPSGGPLPWSGVPIAPSLEAGAMVSHGAVLGGRLFAFSEVQSSKYPWALFAIRPDTSAPAPVLRPLDFTPGAPASRDRVTIDWSEPEDPSRIASYRYSWGLAGTPAATVVISGGAQQLVLDAPTDGSWTLAVRSVDRAGNVSTTSASVTFIRDATPPAMVTMFLQPAPRLDGYQPTNDFTISWVPPPGDPIARYEVSAPLKAEGGRLVRQPESLRAENANDGDYTVTVAAVDRAGNVGPAASLSLRLNSYRPVTYVARVDSRVDQGGNLILQLVGLGFMTKGTTPEVFLDDDAKAPYLYTLRLSDGQYTVPSDGLIRGITLGADYDSGTYRVGVRHAVRGVHFADQPIVFQAPGTVKIGDFSFRWAPRWAAARSSRYHVPFVALLIALAVGLVAVLLAASARSIVETAREGAVLKEEVQALLEGRPALLTVEEAERKLKAMHRRGLGLRVKFSFLVSVLAILIVAGLTVALGAQMIGREQRVLADELLKRSHLLLDSAATRAAASLLDAERGFAIVAGIPSSTGAMGKEALHLTITGPGVPPSANPLDLDYLWATNDPSWPEGSYRSGRLPLDDKLLARGKVIGIVGELNKAAAEDTKMQQLLNTTRLRQEERARLLQISLSTGTPEDKAAYEEAEKKVADTQAEGRRRINELARDEKKGRAGSIPEDFDPRNLKPEYLLYRPVVDFILDGKFTIGMVRLKISTEKIDGDIRAARQGLVRTTLIISLAAIAASIVGAIILAGILIRPLKKLAAGVAQIRDTEDKSKLEDIVIRSRDEIGTLSDAVNEMTRGLKQAAIDKAELLVGKGVQKKFLPLEQEPGGEKGSTGGWKTDRIEIYGYYEGAKGVSGDYFDFQPLDDRHCAVINCDVAGKGVPAAMIMVEVATLFLGWCRDWKSTSVGRGSDGRRRLDALVYTINDMLEERGFTGRFAALTIALFDLDTGTLDVCTAGNNVLHVYDADRGSIVRHPLPETPAAGVFPSPIVEGKSGYPQVRLPLDRGDALFLFTDGFEESKRSFRTYAGDIVPCLEPGLIDGDLHLGTHKRGERDEEFGIPRITDAVNAVFHRGTYRLERHHTVSREDLEFDFGSCTGTVKEAVLALVCVEKVFRIYRDALTGPDHRVHLEKKVDDFLRSHFRQYGLVFDRSVEDGTQGGSIAFSHLKEDPQYDDLTLLVVRRP